MNAQMNATTQNQNLLFRREDEKWSLTESSKFELEVSFRTRKFYAKSNNQDKARKVVNGKIKTAIELDIFKEDEIK